LNGKDGFKISATSLNSQVVSLGKRPAGECPLLAGVGSFTSPAAVAGQPHFPLVAERQILAHPRRPWKTGSTQKLFFDPFFVSFVMFVVKKTGA